MEGHHHVDAKDVFGRNVGILVAVLALFLSAATILAHRAHTDTIISANKAANSWSHYQAKRIRAYQAEMNGDLIKLVAGGNPSSAAVLDDLARQSKKYESDLEHIKEEAEAHERGEEIEHKQATFFDLAEGLLELGMILTSLYFIAHKKLFPIAGAVMAVCGIIVGILGILVK